MSERLFRVILGTFLYIALTLAAFYETAVPIYIYLFIIAFEAITNLRVPKIVTKLRHKDTLDIESEFALPTTVNEDSFKKILFKLEAERYLRVIIFIFVAIPFFTQIESHSYQIYIDYIPWFVATMLCLAGVTNICPMVMFLRNIGMH